MKREKAVAVGNRAGVVEWANAAWSRITGYALDDAIAKPIGELLASAGIDLDVIDFVRGRFERGEPCEIELPLDPPGADRRWIHVAVESLRDRHGEVSHFAAIAWDVTAEQRSATSKARGPETPATLDLRRSIPLRRRATDLSALVRKRLEPPEPTGGLRTAFDLELPDGLPRVAIDRARVGEVVAGLVDGAAAAIGDEWGTISLNAGLAEGEAVFVSPTYPRNSLLRDLPAGGYVFLEIHDTGPPLDRSAIAALSGAERPDGASARVAELAAARALLRAHGGELRVDADAGFGTRVLLLFPGSPGAAAAG